ncbi:MAG: YybH family protein [Planctomycetia bacterium]
MTRFVGGMIIAAVFGLACGAAGAADGDAAVREAVVKASAAYADAYNKRDFAALAEEWVERAELVEGGSRVVGRNGIVASIRGWLDRHAQAAMQIKVADVEFVTPTLARVRGTIAFTRKPGEKPVESRFESLRVLEQGAWRIVESSVERNHAAALDDMSWLVGKWQATDAKAGTTIDAVYEKAIDGRAVIGRVKLATKGGKPVEAIEIIHADRGDGVIRTAIYDSTGAQAEGVIESDGTSLNRSLVGVPGDGVAGSRAQWVQTIVPGGEGRFTMQSIERSLDGRPLPDGQPMHFLKR